MRKIMIRLLAALLIALASTLAAIPDVSAHPLPHAERIDERIVARPLADPTQGSGIRVPGIRESVPPSALARTPAAPRLPPRWRHRWQEHCVGSNRSLAASLGAALIFSGVTRIYQRSSSCALSNRRFELSCPGLAV